MELDKYLDLFVFYVVPPIAFAFHGWLATWMAIGALFRPYEAWYIRFFGWSYQIPGTPGIFPKRQSELAQKVAGTITDTLLTSEDIKRQVEMLVTEQNIYLAVGAFIEAVLKEFRDTEKLHRLARDLSEISPALLKQYVVSLVDSLERGADRRFAAIVEKLFDQIALSSRISKEQAGEIADRIMENLLTPVQVRNFLITLLTPQNIGALDESIQSHATPPIRLLARFINVKNVCNETRKFLETDPEKANKVISDLLKRFELKAQIANKIATFDMRSLPLQSIANLRRNTITFIESFLVEHRQDILSGVERIQGEAMGTVQSAIIRFNPGSIDSQWLDKAKRDISVFIYSYLKRELGAMLERALPSLGTYQLIATKIEQFSPEQLEMLVKRICHKELKLLEVLGTIIGFWLGAIQVAVNVWLQSRGQLPPLTH